MRRARTSHTAGRHRRQRLANPPLLVPVLRAGLGMHRTGARAHPGASVGWRNEATHHPVPYLESLGGRDLRTQPVMVLDPMLARRFDGLHHRVVGARGAIDITVVCVVCAPEGIAALEKAAPQARLFTATIDDGLNDDACYRPWSGDAGDRQFGAAVARHR